MKDFDKDGFTPDQEKQLIEVINLEIKKHPPTIGMVGVSGTGKSSTINSLFNTKLLVSHTVAGTKEITRKEVEVSVASSDNKKRRALLQVIDAPGLGEDIRLDGKYLEMYRNSLDSCDVILWVLTARNRALALDQQYLQQLKAYHHKMVFGINQIDLVEPIGWNQKINQPSLEQSNNIDIILKDRKEKIESIVMKPIKITAYSAQYKFHLQKLFTTIIEACPENRAWIFSAIKGFRPEEEIPEAAREYITSLLDKKGEKRSFRKDIQSFLKGNNKL